MLQVLREVNAFLSRLVHLAVTGSICTNKMDLVFVLGLVSSEEALGSRCFQVCGGKAWVCSRLLHKLRFGKPHVFSCRPVPFCNFFHCLVNTLNQLAKAKVLHPSGLRSAFRLIRSLTKVCADTLFLGESGVGQRMTSPLAVTTQWQDYGEVSLIKPTGLGQTPDTVPACKPWVSAV